MAFETAISTFNEKNQDLLYFYKILRYVIFFRKRRKALLQPFPTQQWNLMTNSPPKNSVMFQTIFCIIFQYPIANKLGKGKGGKGGPQLHRSHFCNSSFVNQRILQSPDSSLVRLQVHER